MPALWRQHESSDMSRVRVQGDDFDLSTEVAQLRANDPKVGAVVSFVGTVRDLNDGVGVAGMELEHYPGMTEQAIETIIDQALARWDLSDALVVHRIGPLLPMAQIVLVVTAAAHRGAAFAACEFIIDYLKTEAPFWKKEQTELGARWVDARSSDQHSLAKWSVDAAGRPDEPAH
ncbi:MAG: molybdopterin synthase catalytic subunit [Janthinobacterium sp.]|jgi:molybdopterin synthase catalytic subunit